MTTEVDKTKGIELDSSEDLSFSDATAVHRPLPIWRKLTFGAGGLPMQMMQSASGFFLNTFMLDTAHVPTVLVSVIIAIARISDAVTDPIMGLLVLKTHTRFGQKRPWILFSIPVFVTSFIAHFCQVKFSTWGSFAFYLCAVVGLQIGLTAFHVPYSSLTMSLTNCPKERDTLTAYRMVSETIGILLGVAVFGAIVNPYRIVVLCSPTEQSNTTAPLNSTCNDAAAQAAEAWAYRFAAITTAVITGLAGLICFFGTREIPNDGKTSESASFTSSSSSSSSSLVELDETGLEGGKAAAAEATPIESTGRSFWRNSKVVLTFKPFLQLMGAFLFMSLGIQFLQNNLLQYITYSLKMGDYFVYGVMNLLVGAVLLIPLVQLLLKHFGKRNTMALGILNAVPLFLTLLFFPEYPHLALYFFAMTWASISISIAMLLPWSMLPDVIDAFYLEHDVRLEGIFYALIVFFNKFAVGITSGISILILDSVGYNNAPGTTTQSPQVENTLRYLVSVVPVALMIPSLVFLYFYPFNNPKLAELRTRVAEKRMGRTESQEVVRTDSETW